MMNDINIGYREPKWAHKEVMDITDRWMEDNTDLDISDYIILHDSEKLKEEFERAERIINIGDKEK